MAQYRGGKIFYLQGDIPVTLVFLMCQHDPAMSKSEAIRLLKNSGVKVNNSLQNKDCMFVDDGTEKEYVIHVGKYDSFLVLAKPVGTEPSPDIVLAKWSKAMRSNQDLTPELVLSWEFGSMC